MFKKNNKLTETLHNVKETIPQKPKTEMESGPIRVAVKYEGKVKEESNREKEISSSDIHTLEKNPNYRFESNHKYFIICVYALFLVVAAGFIIFCIVNMSTIKDWIKNFLGIISPFIAAFFIAFILNPLVKWLNDSFLLNICKIQSVRIRAVLSILSSYLVIIGIIAIAINYVAPQLNSSITDLVYRIPDIFKIIEEDLIPKIQESFPYIKVDVIQEKLNALQPELIAFGTDLVKNAIPVLLNFSVSVAKITINILLSIVISIYMLYDKRKLSKMMTRLLFAFVPVKKATAFSQITKECSSIFTSFVVGKSIDSLIIGVLCFIIMSIIGLPMAVLLSLIVGITNMIPYFGPFIGAVPGILLYLCIKPSYAVIFAIMVFILQQFDGWILGPKILGDSTGLTPLWVIFAITVGGAYGGVLGMFLGVPIIAVIAYLFNQLITSKLSKKKIDIS